jgi:hypothetical protein
MHKKKMCKFTVTSRAINIIGCYSLSYSSIPRTVNTTLLGSTANAARRVTMGTPSTDPVGSAHVLILTGTGEA